MVKKLFKKLGVMALAILSVLLDIVLSIVITVVVALGCLVIFPLFSIFGTYQLYKIKMKDYQ